MADRAPNSRVQSILIDMARMWDRLAIEAVQQDERTLVAPDYA
jgi:hypothetical protein